MKGTRSHVNVIWLEKIIVEDVIVLCHYIVEDVIALCQSGN